MVDAAAGDVEDLLPVVGQQGDHQRRPVGVEIDCPGHRISLAQREDIRDQFQSSNTVLSLATRRDSLRWPSASITMQ